MTQSDTGRQFFDSVEIGVEEELGTYVLTQGEVDNYRLALDDPEAAFPSFSVPRDAATGEQSPAGSGVARVNGRSIRQFFNAPVPGKALHLTRCFVEKYIRRDLPYVVEETTTKDEDGRLIEKMTVDQLLRTQKVDEKWAQPEQKQP